MKSIITVFAVFLLVCSTFTTTHVAFADETYVNDTIHTTTNFRFNNENWFTAVHPEIASFTVRDDGSAYGLTNTGIEFKQYNIANDFGIRIQRFEIQDHYHYIIEGEVVYTPAELSTRLAQAYASHTGV